MRNNYDQQTYSFFTWKMWKHTKRCLRCWGPASCFNDAVIIKRHFRSMPNLNICFSQLCPISLRKHFQFASVKHKSSWRLSAEYSSKHTFLRHTRCCSNGIRAICYYCLSETQWCRPYGVIVPHLTSVPLSVLSFPRLLCFPELEKLKP